MMNITRLPAWQMAARIRDRQFTVAELIDAHFQQIHRLNPKLNAFVSIDEENARRQARLADEAVASNVSLGPLHGVPVTIKSSIDVAGLLCEAGTRLRAGHTAPSDAPLVSRLRSAGAIILGNTTVPEFLMAWETHSALYGTTNNPWNLERTPGGSSGGEAAAISACCSAGGIGSDGGGSIRVPAHFSGICGLKPTPGRIPASGHYPPAGGPFSLIGVVGPMARTVEDLQLLLEVTAGYDAGDPVAVSDPVKRVEQQQAKKLRVGFYEDDGYSPPTPETSAAVRAAADVLEKAGFAVEPFRPEGL